MPAPAGTAVRHAVGCAALLALTACSDAFYLSFDVDVGTRLGFDRPIADRDARDPDDVPSVPGRNTPSEQDPPPDFDPPASCGAQVFPELRYVYDVEAAGGSVAVASWEGTWLYPVAALDRAGSGARLDPRPSWRVRAQRDAVSYLTQDRVLGRASAGAREELVADRALVDFVLRGDDVWASEEGSGRVLALGRGAERVLAEGRDAALMTEDEDAAYVAMPSFGVVRIARNGATEALYVAPPTEGVFAAVGHLTADADWLTFTAWPHGGLARVHKRSGAFEPILDVDDRLVLAAARHGSSLFWLEMNEGDGAMRVMHAAPDGSDAEVLLDRDCVQGGMSLEVLGDDLFVMMEGSTLRVSLR